MEFREKKVEDAIELGLKELASRRSRLSSPYWIRADS